MRRCVSCRVSERRNHDKHAADPRPDHKRQGIVHSFRVFTRDIKADHGADGRNGGEDGRPAVGLFDVPSKGRGADAGREAAQTCGPRDLRCLIDLTAAGGAESCAFRDLCCAIYAIHPCFRLSGQAGTA